MRRKHEDTPGRRHAPPGSPGAADVTPEGVEPAGPLGPETSVRPAPFDPSLEGDERGSSAAELDRLRAREDELLRALAEQQNVTRRRKQEMETSIQYAQESLIRELLPVLDDFERALRAMDERVDESIRAGVALVHDRLLRILQGQGLEVIRPEGERFDPALHDALAQEPAAGAPAGTVVSVAQPGYRFRGRVLRHAKVVVAGPADQGEAAPAARGTRQ